MHHRLLPTTRSDSIQVSWQTSSERFSYDLGGCTVTVSDIDSFQAAWDRISYFVKARMNELTKDVKNGKGYRMLPGILYALFSITVEDDPTFKCIKEAFISSNFEEVAAEVVLHNGSLVPSSWYHLTRTRVLCN